MASKKPVHLTPRGRDGWAVVREGNQRANSVHLTQAERVGRRAARRDHTEFYLHGRNGQMRERDSYGRDPYPAASLTQWSPKSKPIVATRSGISVIGGK